MNRFIIYTRQKRNAATGILILRLYSLKKLIKNRKLETELIENVIFAIFYI